MQNQNNVNKDEDDISMYYPGGDAENMERDDQDDAFINQNIKKKNRIRKKSAKLTKSQIALIVAIFVIYTSVIFAAAWLIFYKPAQPSIDEIPFETDPMYSESDMHLNGDQDNPGGQNGVVNDGYKVRDGVYNILVVGHDDAAHLADVTMIVNCNTVDNSISVMQIPRDTLVTEDVVTNKVNAAFSTFYSNAYTTGTEDPYAEAMKAYASMFEKSLCIKIHHTIIMNLSGFRNIVDALGGVDVYVPEDMYYSDPEQDLYISIPKGDQHLDGYNAESFVRFRSGYLQADLGRVNAQKIFLTAMFNKVKSTIKAADISTISSLASEVFSSVSTDLSVSDIIFYAKFLLNVDLESINMTTMPGNVAGAYYVMNRAAALEIINKYFNIYNKDITDSIFDRNYLFCFTSQQYLADVYFDKTENVFDEVHNACDIDKDSIYIP